VVAGAIPRSGLKRAAFGNTAELLLDCLPCDLLVVKPTEFKCPVPLEIRGGRLATAEPSDRVLGWPRPPPALPP